MSRGLPAEEQGAVRAKVEENRSEAAVGAHVA